jgi:hypothetical protein
MSKLYEAYRTDKSAEANGVWVREGDAEFCIARMGGANTKYQRALTAAMKPHMREMQLGMLDEAIAEPIMRKVFIETVLLGWRYTDEKSVLHEDEVLDEQDAPLLFNQENAEKLFADLPDLYARLREQAGSYANYRAALLADLSKN